MSEGRLVLLLAAVWLGATLAWPVPLLPAVGGVALALVLRWERVFVVACGAIALSLGAAADRGYQPVVPASYDGPVQMVTDPERWSFGVSAEGRLDDGRRVRLSASGQAASGFDRAVAGSTLLVSGRLAPLEDQPWLRSRHLVGELKVVSSVWSAGPPWWQQPSELLRRLVADGASVFDPDEAALYTGLVIGDDREQSSAQQARFRSAGLSHLLAVSGQNVAFALAVLWPLARRFEGLGRLLVVGAALFVFALATRLEPSVVRATVTAGVAATAVLLGRPASGVRTLCLTVSGLVLVDPFLVDSVGFRLSVAATAGILVLGPVLLERIRGPRPLAAAVAITVSAQVFVMPLLIGTFGPVSLVAVPANLLAGWAAGLVMVWGLSVGLVAGVVPGGEWLQWPVGLLLGWLDGVAVWAARVPAPFLGGAESLVLAGMVVVGWLVWARVRWPVMVAVLALLAVFSSPGPVVGVLHLDGAVFYAGEKGSVSVLVVSADASLRLVEQLVDQRMTSDVVVFERAGRSQRRLAGAVVEVVGPGLVLAPPQHSLVGARRVSDAVTVGVANGVLTFTPDGTTLQVDVEPS